VYANRQLLQQLLDTAAQAVRGLAAAAAEAASSESNHQQHQQIVVNSSSSSSSSSALKFVQAQPGLAVAADAAAAAAGMAQNACQLLQYSAAAAAAAAAAAGADTGEVSQQHVRVIALQKCLSAVDAALNSTIPTDSSSSSSIFSVVAGVGGVPSTLVQQLMVCRQLLACSWLPPLAAAAAAANTAAAASAGSQQRSAEAAPAAAGNQSSSSSSSSSSGAASTKQLLRSALATLSAVSNSSTHSDAAAAPLLLLTEDQAAVLQPLLREAGLDTATDKQQQHQLGAAGSSGSSSSRSSWVDLASVTLRAAAGSTATVSPAGCDPTSLTGAATAAASDSMSEDLLPAYSAATAAAADLLGVVVGREASGVQMQVHEGAGGQLLLQDMISMTDQAQQVLRYWQEEQQQQQQQQGSSSSSVVWPAELPLQLLRASADVVQLLLRCHPNSSVRQLMYVQGLTPLLILQQQVCM
jgi:hypothetical protein